MAIVTYTHRRKQARKPAKASQPMPAVIVTAKKPGKTTRHPEPDDGQTSESVKAFFKRMIQPPGD